LITQNRLVDTIKGREYLSGVFDIIWILPRGKVSRLPDKRSTEVSLRMFLVTEPPTKQ
jgi:hypothetical protein